VVALFGGGLLLTQPQRITPTIRKLDAIFIDVSSFEMYFSVTLLSAPMGDASSGDITHLVAGYLVQVCRRLSYSPLDGLICG
jgi:hypothetical protein